LYSKIINLAFNERLPHRENWDKISSQKLSQDQYVNGDLNGHHSDEEQIETDNYEIQIQQRQHPKPQSNPLPTQQPPTIQHLRAE
jgi:hypothetical protein